MSPNQNLNWINRLTFFCRFCASAVHCATLIQKYVYFCIFILLLCDHRKRCKFKCQSINILLYDFASEKMEKNLAKSMRLSDRSPQEMCVRFSFQWSKVQYNSGLSPFTIEMTKFLIATTVGQSRIWSETMNEFIRRTHWMAFIWGTRERLVN